MDREKERGERERGIKCYKPRTYSQIILNNIHCLFLEDFLNLKITHDWLIRIV